MGHVGERTGRRRAAVAAAGILLCVCGGFVIAQTALDANLSSSGQRVNTPRAQMSMAAPIYTVNRSTGEMQYNRANAFRDPTYNIFQRYTMDRTEYFYADQSGRARGSPYQNPQQSYRSSPTRPQSMRSVRMSDSAFSRPGASAARTPSYSALRATPPNVGMSGLHQPSYRPGGGARPGSTGRVNTRVGARRY